MSRNAGHLLRRFRDKNGLSQVAMASRIGITGTMVYLYERGKASPGERTKLDIASATGGAVPVSSWPIHARGPGRPRKAAKSA